VIAIPSEKWVEKPLASIVLMNNEDSVSDEELIDFIKRLCKISDSQRLCLYK
jgi:fatty-acyl-CoA synthase